MFKHLLTGIAILAGGSLMARAPATVQGVLPPLTFMLVGSGGGGADDGAGHEASHEASHEAGHEAGDDRGVHDEMEGEHEAGDDQGIDVNDLPDDSDPVLLIPAARGKRS